MADALLAAACVASAGGVVALRFAWSLPRRSVAWSGTGWGLLTLGAVLGWVSHGAWGTALAALFAMAAALLALAYAAATSPAGARGKASNRRVGALPQAGEPWRLGRRIATFLLAVPLAAILATGVAIAARALLAAGGAGEANANVASFYAMPLAWGLLACAILMETRRVRQWRLLGLAAVPGTLALIAGLAS